MARLSKIARECVWNKFSTRPADYNTRDNCEGDCTTRAMAFVLAGQMGYHEIEDEQYRLAREMGKRRNHTGVYDRILVDRGWRWIQFDRKVSEGEVAVRLGRVEKPFPALALSRTHIAAVANGSVVDIWDSRGCAVFAILVPGSFVKAAIEAFDVDCWELEPSVVPVRQRSPRHRSWRW